MICKVKFTEVVAMLCTTLKPLMRIPGCLDECGQEGRAREPYCTYQRSERVYLEPA